MTVFCVINGAVVSASCYDNGEVFSNDFLARLRANVASDHSVDVSAVLVYQDPGDTLFGKPLDTLSPTVVDGQVTAITEAATSERAYVQVSLSGGDGKADPIGINLDGSNPITVDIAIRDSADARGNVLPISGEWRVVLRDEGGAVYDIVPVTLTLGAATLNYKPENTFKPAIIHLQASDMTNVPGYELVLANAVVMKVYRVL